MLAGQAERQRNDSERSATQCLLSLSSASGSAQFKIGADGDGLGPSVGEERDHATGRHMAVSVPLHQSQQQVPRHPSQHPGPPSCNVQHANTTTNVYYAQHSNDSVASMGMQNLHYGYVEPPQGHIGSGQPPSAQPCMP